jgi:hypothetical protein
MKKFALLVIFGFLLVQAVYSTGQSETQAQKTPPRTNGTLIFVDDAFSEMERAFAESETESTLQDEYFLGRAVAANTMVIYKPMAIQDVLRLLLSTENSQRSGFNTTHSSARERITNVAIWVGSRQVRDNNAARASRFRKAMD